MIKKLIVVCIFLLVPTVSRAAVFSATTGSLVKFQTSPRVYLVADETGGLEWIQTEQDFKKRGFSFSQVKILSDAVLSNFHYVISTPHVDVPVDVSKVEKTTINPKDALVLVVDDNRVVVDEGSHTKWCLASISKLMTALVLNEMNLNWNATIVQSRADEVGGARLRVAVGSKYKRIDLLHASLMGSANNSTHALARTSGLSMQQFVARMNTKAKELGMNDTHFEEPTGLSTNNISTAHDIAILIDEANKIPRIAEIGRKKTYTLSSIEKRPKHHTIKTTNKLLLGGESVALGKTGYINESRYNFTVVGETPSGGSRTIVILNAPNLDASFKLAKAYLHLEI